MLPADVGRDWKADDLAVAGAAGPRRRRDRGEGRVPRRADRRTSTAATGCRPTLSGTGRRPTASPSWAPRSAPPPSTRSMPTATATRSWCSTTSDLEVVRSAADAPLVFDLRDGLLVEARPGRPRPAAPRHVAGARAAGPTYYDMVRIHDLWIEDGTLLLQPLGRARFASGNMTLLRPETYLVDTYEWPSDEDGPAAPASHGCLVHGRRRRSRAVRRRRGRRPPRLVAGRRPETFGDRRSRPGFARATGSAPASRPAPTRAWWSRGRTGGRCATTTSRSPTRAGLDGAAHVGHLRRRLAPRHLGVRPGVRRGARAGRTTRLRAAAGRRRGRPAPTRARCGRG